MNNLKRILSFIPFDNFSIQISFKNKEIIIQKGVMSTIKKFIVYTAERHI